jgi:hypothetical protein
MRADAPNFARRALKIANHHAHILSNIEYQEKNTGKNEQKTDFGKSRQLLVN